MGSVRWAVASAVAGALSVGLFTIAGIGFLRQMPQVKPAPPHVSVPPTGIRGSAPAQQQGPEAVLVARSPETGYYDDIRSRMRWVERKVGGQLLLTPDHDSRMLLAKAAARKAQLAEVGLGFTDVYGIINAETSWVPRRGASKDGTPNLGIAQFEPATARALGVRDPEDAVEAVHAAALHIKEAAQWSNDRLSGLKLGHAERAVKLREGVSIYYNLSTRGRNTWNGRNTEQLPRETQRHIINARLGAQEAAMLDAQLRSMSYRDQGAIVTASAGQAGG